MVADHLELVPSALIGVLSVGLSQSNDADRSCMWRLSPLSAALTAASADLRTHTLSTYTSLSSGRARRVMCEVVVHDPRLQVNEIVRFVLSNQPPVAPPALDTVFAMPSVPAPGRTPTFCRGGGDP